MTTRRSVWWLLPAGLGAAAVSLAWSPGNVFFASDLSFYYWPVHLWFRHALEQRTLPLWDPFVGFGQAAIAEPTRHLFFPPALLLRLLAPAAIGFNLFVALPVPLFGAGLWAYLRGRVTDPVAAVVAAALTLSGPLLSLVAYPNLAWSVAALPWALTAARRVSQGGRTGPLALVLGLQALAGEPLSFGLTLGLACLETFTCPDAAGGRLGRLLRLAGATLWGLALAAVQLLPAAVAAARSARARVGVPDLLSLHPISLLETLAWPLLADPAGSWRQPDPWLRHLNDGHEPLYASLYLGAPLLALALAGAAGRPGRGGRWWALVGIAGACLALGRHTPILPWLQALVPVLTSFRYPSKYLILALLAVAILAAEALDRLGSPSRATSADRMAWGLAGGFAGGTALLGLAGLVATGPLWWVSRWLGEAATIPSPELGATLLATALRGHAASLLALGVGTAVALAAAASGRIRPRAAGWALGALLLADLLAHAPTVNPTLDATLLGEPEWVRITREHPEDRVYVGGRVSWFTGRPDPDDIPRRGAGFAETASRRSVAAVYQSSFATLPSAWGVRDAISVDLAAVWPAETHAAYERFAAQGLERRDRFLSRSGVRYYLTSRPPAGGARLVRVLERFPAAALHEDDGRTPRATLVHRHRLAPSQPEALDALFDAAVDTRAVVTLEATPPALTGSATPSPGRGGVRWLKDGPGRQRLHTTVPDSGGFLVISDSWDPDWTARVDGQRVPLLRANGLFRAVRLGPGDHEVELRYAPMSLLAGAALSVLALLGLALPRLRRRGGRPESD